MQCSSSSMQGLYAQLTGEDLSPCSLSIYIYIYIYAMQWYVRPLCLIYVVEDHTVFQVKL